MEMPKRICQCAHRRLISSTMLFTTRVPTMAPSWWVARRDLWVLEYGQRVVAIFLAEAKCQSSFDGHIMRLLHVVVTCFSLHLPEAKALYSCLRHGQRALDTSQLVPRRHVIDMQRTKNRLSPLWLVLSTFLMCPFWLHSVGTATQRRARCTEGEMLLFSRSSRDSFVSGQLFEQSSASRYKRSSSGTAKDIDWDGRLVRNPIGGYRKCASCGWTMVSLSQPWYAEIPRSKQEKLVIKSLPLV